MSNERPNRPRDCKVCLSPNCDAVNAAIGNNLGLKEIVGMFGGEFSRTGIYRHSLHADVKKVAPVVASVNRARELRSRVEKLLLAAEDKGDVKTASVLISRLMDLDNRILDVSPARTAPPRVTVEYLCSDGESYESRPYISHIISAEGYELVLRLVLERLAENIEMKNVSPELQVAAEKFLDALILDKKQQEEKPKESEKSNGLSNETAGTASSVGLSERGGDSGGTSGGGNSDRNITKSAE